MKTIITSACLIVLLSLGSCRTGKASLEAVRTYSDSTITKVTQRQRDTTITIPGDTTRISIPIYEITEVPITKTIGRSTATVYRNGNNLEFECECAEYKQKIALLETIIEKQQTVIDQLKETETIPVKYVPLYIQILAWTGGIAIGGGLSFIGAKLLK